MSKNKMKIMLSIMREISDGNEPTWTDYGIEKNEFADIIDACRKEGFIENAAVARGGMGHEAKTIWLGVLPKIRY